MNLLFALFIASMTHADGISETFSSRANYVPGTAIWNQALGVIHPTLQVMNFRAGFTPRPVEVGDGSDGSFDISTYARFSVGGDLSGNIIRLDLATYPELNVTNFHLAAGWTIEPVGDQPLIIYSLSDVIIDGDIHCEGGNGTNAIGTAPGSGGTGRCGGKNGGAGGAQFGSGTNGDSASVGVVTGGGGGVDSNAAATVGGGGGGGWNSTSATGNGVNSSAPNGGLGGTTISDPEIITRLGGSGGGGGGGNDNVAGAGGGAGGGVVIIHAVRDFDITGFIYANGGNGGSSNVVGGPGGGGAGGTVEVFVGRTINIFNGGAASQADSGTGGTNSLAVAGASGASGRSWFSSVNYNSTTGFYTPAEQLPVVPGNVEFNSATQTVTTAAIDLLQSRAEVTALSVSPASTDFLFEVSGSNDGFVTDDTGWTTNLSSLSQKRYLKFRIAVTTSDVDDPTMLDSVNLTYTSHAREEFKLEAAGCGRVEDHDSGNGPSRTFPLLFLFVMLLLLKLKSELQKRVGN